MILIGSYLLSSGSNPDMYSMDAQDPYTGDTEVILKADYKVGWVLDENGEPNYSF